MRRLHSDDAATLKTLAPEDVQDWCLSRIADYRSRIRIFRDQPDLVMYNASFHRSVARHKSNMCALRSVYNDAAPVHRSLPPEILLQIFANFCHGGARRGHPALRVCHYWHALLQRTPQLWKSLLGLEFLVKWEPQWKIDRFRAAFSKSAPLNLSLRLRGIDSATVDILAPYAHRISSMTIRIGCAEQWEALDRFLELDMPMRELEIRIGIIASDRATEKAHIVRFFAFEHLQALRLSNISCEPPEAPHTALRHLELNCCWGPNIPHSPSSLNVDLQTVLATIRNCPNLETLCITGWSHNLLSDLDLPVDVPRLRHIILQISFESTLALLSRLTLPSTVLLDLEPRFSFQDYHVPLPLSTSLVSLLDRPPTVEVAMHFKFLFTYRSKNVATWEARGGGSRPLRLSTFLYVSLYSPDKTLAYTEQVLAIYAPGTAVTSLTIAGARRAKSKSFWAAILAGLPHLTRLAVDGSDVRDSPMLLSLLAKVQRDGGCLCPVFADLSVFWDERAPSLGGTRASTALDTLSLAEIDEGDHWPLPRSAEALFWPPYGPPETHAYCRVLELCLRRRGAHGCSSLRTLSVSIWDYWEGRERRDVCHEAASAVEAILREGLRGLVEGVSVKLQSEWEV